MDPACPELMEVRRGHKRQQRLVAASMETNETLRNKFLTAEAKDAKSHVATCSRCNTFFARNRCKICRHGLIREVPGPRCTSGWHRFRIKMGWLPKADKPKAKPAPKPGPAPTTVAPKNAKAARKEEPARAPPPPEPVVSVRPEVASARPPPPPPQRPAAQSRPAAPRNDTRPARAAAQSDASTAVTHKAPPQPKPKKKAPAKPHAHVVLGVDFDADESEVRQSFREKAKSYHPDKVAHMAPEFRALAERHMRELNEAYGTMIKRVRMKEKSA